MACDMRVASRDARFLLPESKVGLGRELRQSDAAAAGARTHAFEILYGAEPFDAAHAEQYGFVSESWRR